MHTVAVIGGSNGGYAAAADFAEQGHTVQWYVRSPDNHAAVLDSQSVTLAVSPRYEGRDERRTIGPPSHSTVTTDLAEAVSGADAVVVPLPTTAQRGSFPTSHRFSRTIKSCCSVPETSVRILRQSIDELDDPPENVTVAETPTLPYVTRRSDDAESTINLDAVALPIGAYPGDETDRALAVVEGFYESAIPAENALDSALNNSNSCVNAVPTVLNAGAIESDEIESFNIHRHGIGDGVYNALMSLDEERVRIREELGYDEPHFTQDEYYRPGGRRWALLRRKCPQGADERRHLQRRPTVARRSVRPRGHQHRDGVVGLRRRVPRRRDGDDRQHRPHRGIAHGRGVQRDGTNARATRPRRSRGGVRAGPRGG
ncbi:hypothetical protein D8S78_23495 [Natrialba swarupiae]|nr:hypothetical protein [Natrialba swarupiae]